MIGVNFMLLNGASMCDAVQFWLDSKFKEGQSPLVQSVLWNGTEFRVLLKQPEKKDAGAMEDSK